MFRFTARALLASLVTVSTPSHAPHVGVITFNSPATRNAMTEEMGDAFRTAVQDIKSKDDVRCVVVTANGSAFSAGGDLKFLRDRISSTREENIKTMRAFYERFLCIRTLKVPTIAAMNGHAIGAGLCLALACDIRIAAANGKYGVNFVRLGIHPGMGATYFLPKIIGVANASRMLLAGSLISAQVALEMNIVSQIVDEGTMPVLTAAMKIAEEISTAASPFAVRQTVKTLRHDVDDMMLDAALQREAEAQADCYASKKEIAEALAAMREKRAPVF